MSIKSALVTGAAQGIGKSIATQLARDGFNVAIADLPYQREKGTQLAEDLKSHGVKTQFIEVDVTDRDQVFAAVEKTYQAFSSFDVMVNNAGICQVTPLLEVTKSQVEKIQNININGPLWGIQAAARKFIEIKKPGKIINACSFAGFKGIPILSIYSSTKFAVKGLAQAAAQELGVIKFEGTDKRITVNNYCPGIVLTPMWDEIDAGLAKIEGLEKGVPLKRYLDGILLGRGEKPEDVTNLVSFLASDKSDYITGQSILVDGGLFFS
ncbi:uncharacterized protein PRCAT00002491001 [Priceomyces carsonii]|uniref:uncharacterized protein n=1 Tax=Priceomyces carsonii TaxID=28549 RepID=UPI002ED9DF2A|nr:unnamed protein product [Priceomyces carsonii]